jgi:hypothetical protein
MQFDRFKTGVVGSEKSGFNALHFALRALQNRMSNEE